MKILADTYLLADQRPKEQDPMLISPNVLTRPAENCAMAVADDTDHRRIREVRAVSGRMSVLR